MIHTETFLLRVQGEPIGVAYGTENWFRAAQFVTLKGEGFLPPHQRPRLSPPIWQIAKGYSGSGDDEVPF